MMNLTLLKLILRTSLMSCGIALLLTNCRTSEPSPTKVKAIRYSKIPKASNCPTGEGLLPCVHFKEGKGGDTEEPLKSNEINIQILSDLAKFYGYQRDQLGKEYDDDHVFKGLSFEEYRILAISGSQSTKGGRTIRLEKLVKEGDALVAHITLWRPREKNSACEQFSLAISRPYLFVKIPLDAFAQYTSGPAELEVVKTERFYRCRKGQVVE